MHDEELQKAQNAIPLLLDDIAGKGGAPLSAPDLVEALRSLGIDEEAVRLAMWYLIDRGSIELTPDWRVRQRVEKVPAP